ncbi:MAG: hypothetical protein RLZZ238_1648 [Planctomycetota bacterium]
MRLARFTTATLATAATACTALAEKTHFTYLWHLEQPIYWPDRQAGTQRYERAWQSILRRDAGAAHPENDLRGIFGLDDRVAAYQYRPRDCVSAISWASEAGAQVSYSGGLIANIQSFAEAGGQLGYSTNWHGPWRESRNWQTNTPGADHPRMDIVMFSFHHALLPLVDGDAIRKELAIYKEIYPQAWGAVPGVSKGFFPSEMAFSMRLIPYLAEAGIDWSFVSGEKLSRACAEFPVVFGSGGINCDPPNRADQINPAQANYRRISISRGCGPAEAVPFAYTPHRAKHVDPATGAESFITVVPCSQHLGWMDGYNPMSVGELGALEPFNDPARPMLVVLAHDGDNAWGGGYSYYMEAVPNFVSTAEGQGYKATVVQKYLTDHPVPAGDLVHVEDGAWVNADGDFGAPQFLNWNWPPVLANGQIDIANGWAEDIRNWAVITAAQNFVSTAEQIHAGQGLPTRTAQILAPNTQSRASERAWHFFLGSLNSGYMYYGTSLDMEVKPTVACNEAIAEAQTVIGAGTGDQTGPTVWVPQRFPWNPGSVNFGPQYGYQQYQSNGDFTVWTFVHDVSGTQSVTLKYRLDDDGMNPLSDNANELYAGGAGVGAWQSLPMTRRAFPAGNFFNSGSIDFFEMPSAIADQYYAEIVGVRSALVDYYIEAVDARGNIRRSPIQHVWVGDGSGAGGGGGGGGEVVTVSPDPLIAGGSATVTYNPQNRPLAGATTVRLHYGYNNWSQVASPDATMAWNAKTQRWTATVPIIASATQFDFVFNNGAGVWDNNGGADWHVAVEGGAPANEWIMDGQLDADAVQVAVNGSRHLWAGIKDGTLYVATEDSGEGDDTFVFVGAPVGGLRAAPWAKSGQVAAWSAFLADENDNDYEGWFNQLGNTLAGAGNPQAATGANGGVVEGTLDLAAYLGAMPEEISLAVGPYATGDGGSLRAAGQAPASVNGNATLDAAEFATVRACAITIAAAGAEAGTCCPADFNGSGTVDAADLALLLGAWGTTDASLDLNGSGTVDAADLALVLGAWGGC